MDFTNNLNVSASFYISILVLFWASATWNYQDRISGILVLLQEHEPKIHELLQLQQALAVLLLLLNPLSASVPSWAPPLLPRLFPLMKTPRPPCWQGSSEASEQWGLTSEMQPSQSLLGPTQPPRTGHSWTSCLAHSIKGVERITITN